LRLVDGLAGLIIWLDRSLDIGFIFEPFGLGLLALPLVGPGNLLRFLAQFIVYFYLLVIYYDNWAWWPLFGFFSLFMGWWEGGIR